MLAVDYPDSRHVVELGLDTATDRAIWDYAGEHGFVLVSKDSDFRQLAFLLGPPPKTIWVRAGNASTRDILSVLREHGDVIATSSTPTRRHCSFYPSNFPGRISDRDSRDRRRDAVFEAVVVPGVQRHRQHDA